MRVGGVEITRSLRQLGLNFADAWIRDGRSACGRSPATERVGSLTIRAMSARSPNVQKRHLRRDLELQPWALLPIGDGNVRPLSGGFAGPDKSIPGRVTRPVGTLRLAEVHHQLHVSTTVVSTASARSDALASSNLDNFRGRWSGLVGRPP